MSHTLYTPREDRSVGSPWTWARTRVVCHRPRTLSEEDINDEYVRKMTPSENFGLHESILPYGNLFNGWTAISDAPMSSRSLHRGHDQADQAAPYMSAINVTKDQQAAPS